MILEGLHRVTLPSCSKQHMMTNDNRRLLKWLKLLLMLGRPKTLTTKHMQYLGM